MEILGGGTRPFSERPTFEPGGEGWPGAGGTGAVYLDEVALKASDAPGRRRGASAARRFRTRTSRDAHIALLASGSMTTPSTTSSAGSVGDRRRAQKRRRHRRNLVGGALA